MINFRLAPDGAAIKELMQARGLSINRLSKQTGISRLTIATMLADGRGRPFSSRTIDILADALGTYPDALIKVVDALKSS